MGYGAGTSLVNFMAAAAWRAALLSLAFPALGLPRGAAHARRGWREATHTRHGCAVAAPRGDGLTAHAITSAEWSAPLAATIAQLLEVDEARAAWLCELGAAYVGSERVLDATTHVGADAHLRVHLRPKRHPVATAIDWRELILHESADFVVVEKPRGVPVHETVSNARENVRACLGAALGEASASALQCPHRLDTPTRGLLVVARSKRFLSAFNALLRERRVRKVYRALCAPSHGPAAAPGPAPLQPGLLRHYAPPCKFPPCEVRAAPGSPGEWRVCESAVLGVRRVRVSFEARSAAVATAPAASADATDALDVEIELRTGRTHQLRAQLAHEGWPILGDSVYSALSHSAVSAACVQASDARTSQHASAELHVPATAPVRDAGAPQPDDGSDAQAAEPFFGLCATRLAFQCPLGSGRAYEFELPEDRVWL